jgi:hypothetical protein
MEAASKSKVEEYIWTWCCDNCGVEGGMTTQIQQCPGCDHYRCSDCPLEATSRGRAFYSVQSAVQPCPSPPRSGGLRPLQPSSKAQGCVSDLTSEEDRETCNSIYLVNQTLAQAPISDAQAFLPTSIYQNRTIQLQVFQRK